MSYEVFYDQERQVVRTRFEGALSTFEMAKAIRRACEIAREYNCKRYHADVRQGVAEEPVGRFFTLMEGLEELGFDRKDRIAIVYGRDAEKHEFSLMVAHNRGWHNMRFFGGEAEAEIWILEED